jgi:hypothetical protein
MKKLKPTQDGQLTCMPLRKLLSIVGEENAKVLLVRFRQLTELDHAWPNPYYVNAGPYSGLIALAQICAVGRPNKKCSLTPWYGRATGCKVFVFISGAELVSSGVSHGTGIFRFSTANKIMRL